MMKKTFLMLMAFVAVSLGAFSQTNLRDGFQEYKLKNGLTVYLWVDKEKPNVYGQLSVRAGSIDEPADFTGLAHYLEHMLFKGTQQIGALDWAKEKPMYEQIIKLYDEKAKLKDPKKDKVKRDELTKKINDLSVAVSKISKGSEFSTLIQATGGINLNAYTNFDQTVYHNEFPTNQTENWLQLYVDHFTNPVYREFQAEMENVFEEFNMRTPNVGYQQYMSMVAAVFKGSNYARGVIGLPEHLKNPSLSPMIKFFEDWYVPNNMGLLLYGNFDPEAVKPMIEKTFGQMKYKELPKRVPTTPTPLKKNQKIKIKIGYTPSVRWAFDGIKRGHPDEFKVEFMLAMLNNKFNTGLFDKLSMEGTIGSAGATMLSMRDCGKMLVFAVPYYDVSQGTYESDAATERLVMAEINKLKRGQIPSWLFQSVKESYLQDLKLLEESEEIKISMATDAYVYDFSMEEYFKLEQKIRAITINDVKEMANKYFSGNYLTISYLPGEPKIELFDKSDIAKLETPDEEYSDYYKNFLSRPVPKQEPKFVDFSDIQEEHLFNGGKLFYVKNPKNDIFSLTLEYKVGTHTDKKLSYAATLMNYAGTLPNTSNNEIRRELAKYGANYGIGASTNGFFVSVTGNEKDLDKIMPIIFRLFLMPKLENKQIEAVIGSAVQNRMFEQRIPGVISNALMQYIQFGDKSPYIDRIPSKELMFLGSSGYNFLINNEVLTSAIQKVTSYPVEIHYAGAKPLSEVANILKGTVPTQQKIVEPQKPFYADRVKYDNPEIYFLPNTEIQQANVTMYFPIGDYDISQSVDYTAFTRYFGAGGLNTLTFMEIREKRSLAYGTSGYTGTNAMNKTSWFMGSTGTQNDKVNIVVDVYMDLLKNMPQHTSFIGPLKAQIKSELQSYDVSFRDKSVVFENLKKQGYTDDPAKTQLPIVENLTFDDIVKFYNQKIKNAPVIIIIHGNPKFIDLKAIESKYGKVNRVPKNKIFQGGEL